METVTTIHTRLDEFKERLLDLGFTPAPLGDDFRPSVLVHPTTKVRFDAETCLDLYFLHGLDVSQEYMDVVIRTHEMDRAEFIGRVLTMSGSNGSIQI